MKDNEQNPNNEALTPKTKKKTSMCGFIKKFLSIFGIKNRNKSEDRLEEILEKIKSTDVLEEVEKQIMLKSVAFRKLTVEDIMVHRSDIVAVENKIDKQELEKIISESKHTRFPVYIENLDNIKGFIHIKDLIKMDLQKEIDLSEILRPIPAVTSNILLSKLLVKMRASHTHMAVVVDEYGGVDGIVTFEDIIEEIIGEVYDEHDRELEPDHILLVPNKLVKAKARFLLEDLEKIFEIKFSEDVLEDIDTVGGLIFSIEGRVPSTGELIKYENILEFKIIEADNRSIKWVEIKKVNDDNEEKSE